MPARKPQGLKTRHDTSAEKAGRIASEEAMEPEHELPENAPARLKGHPVAAAAWRRCMRMYNQLEARIVTRLDQELLINYCILIEQVDELDHMRKVAYDLWLELSARHDKIMSESRTLAQSENQEDLQASEKKEEEAIRLATMVVGAFEAVTKLDSRVDRKRDLVFKMGQSLYLTPRARAGTAPSKKEKEEPPDDMEELLGDVTNFVNRSGDGK